jgi:flagellar biogenesis protein FliO
LIGEGQDGLKFGLALVVVLALIALTTWLVSRFGGKRPATATARGRQRRLAVIGAASVDGRRRIVLLLNNLLLAVGGLPAPRIENLAEWDTVAPPITQAAEAISMALRDRNPIVASMLLEIAAKCAAMRAAVKGDEGNPPAPDRIKHREQQISEWQADIERAIRELADAEP